MAMKSSLRSKTVIKEKVLEQVSALKYLGNIVSSRNGKKNTWKNK
jgi:hypothetical protein